MVEPSGWTGRCGSKGGKAVAKVASPARTETPKEARILMLIVVSSKCVDVLRSCLSGKGGRDDGVQTKMKKNGVKRRIYKPVGIKALKFTVRGSDNKSSYLH
jgi:hypothetical protein